MTDSIHEQLRKEAEEKTSWGTFDPNTYNEAPHTVGPQMAPQSPTSPSNPGDQQYAGIDAAYQKLQVARERGDSTQIQQALEELRQAQQQMGGA